MSLNFFSKTNHFSFSGHETFACKTLWLKKGYDFIINGGDFNAPDAVAELGVGKNMVSSIRFWLKVFGIAENDKPTELGRRLFGDGGWDPFCEDMATLWLLHYSLVNINIASIYNMVFTGLRRSKIEFTRIDVQNYIEMACRTASQTNVYNEGTVKKDIGVLLQNYVYPSDSKNIEDYSNLLIGLDLIRKTDNLIKTNGKTEHQYRFSLKEPKDIIPELLLYAVLDTAKNEKVLSYDSLSNLSLIFGLGMTDFKILLKDLSSEHEDIISFSDNSGIINIGINNKANKFDILRSYYEGK